MSFSIATSYFYQIRNFKPWMIPVSTAVRDPAWFRPPPDKEYFRDKNGVICGLRYEPLIVQKYGTEECMGLRQECPFYTEGYQCECMQEYEQLLFSIVNKEKALKAFEYCLNKFNANTIVLIVYETPDNSCSEREGLQLFFDCKELKYPIK